MNLTTLSNPNSNGDIGQPCLIHIVVLKVLDAPGTNPLLLMSRHLILSSRC